MRSDRVISFRALLVSAIALSAFAACAQAQTYNLRVIHRFTGAPDDGSVPMEGVRFDGAGNLYGTTNLGGTYNNGTIFKIAQDGTETILHSFGAKAGGLAPNEVTVDPATGDLYGTTINGGKGYGDGDGLIYKLATDGTYTVLHTFDAASDGSTPSGPLFRDRQGNLYGSSVIGGAAGVGTVFEYGADGTFTVLHTFTGPDGARPTYGVIRDRAGNFYGVTQRGGADNDGTIYKLAPDGTVTTLYTFTGGADGSVPESLVGDQSGNLYGTTFNIGVSATIFKLAPDGTFTTLYTFTDASAPPNPVLPINGSLYGTHDAWLYKLAPDGTFTVLHTFTQREGLYSSAPLTLRNGRLFGTTNSFYIGTSAGGTVFSLSEVK